MEVTDLLDPLDLITKNQKKNRNANIKNRLLVQ